MARTTSQLYLSFPDAINQQTEELWQGEFMTFREEEKAMAMLYRVQSFYVEVYYRGRDNAIIRLNPFRSRARPGLYFQASLN